MSACTERSRSVDPLAAIGGQDRLSPYAAMGNQPEFAVDPEGLEPKNFQTAGSIFAEPDNWANFENRVAGLFKNSTGLFGTSGGRSGGTWDQQSFAEHIQNVTSLRINAFLSSIFGGGGSSLFICNFGDGGMNPQSEKKGSKEDIWDVNGDGKLSKREADKHYMKGNEEPITVNGNNIGLSGLRAENMKYNSKTDIYTLRLWKHLKSCLMKQLLPMVEVPLSY